MLLIARISEVEPQPALASVHGQSHVGWGCTRQGTRSALTCWPLAVLMAHLPPEVLLPAYQLPEMELHHCEAFCQELHGDTL